MKKLGALILFVGSMQLSAQNDPLFSHYMFNPTYYNPGWLGDVNNAFVVFQHRSQWAGYTTTYDGPGGAPTTQLMTLAVPVDGLIHSAGMNLSYDQVGIESTLKIQAGASYNFNFNSGVLSVGIMPSLITRTLRFDDLRFEDPSDPFNIGTRESSTKPDLAAGVFFKSYSGYFAGAAVDHVFKPSLIQVQGAGSELKGKLKRTYYFHGGRAFQANRDLDITPTFLVKTDLRGFSLDLSGVATYRNTMWAGLSYRRSESAILLMGYNFLENKELKVGYSFDYVAKDQQAKKRTSHEIFVRYNLPSFVLGGRKAIKTPRFSF